MDSLVDGGEKVGCASHAPGSLYWCHAKVRSFGFEFHVRLKDPEDYSFDDFEACVPDSSFKVTKPISFSSF